MTHETLRDLLDREGQLPMEDALAFARQMATFLERSHGGGAHGRLCPETVALSADGRSLAELIQPPETASDVDDAGYRPPEAWRGEPLDVRSDQYSVACILYEMLAGHAPFPGTGAVLGQRHESDPVSPVRTVRPAVPEALDAVLARALSKLPADRFASLAEFAAALEMAERGVTPRGVTPVGAPVRTRPGEAAGRQPSGGPRSATLVRVGGAALGALVVGYLAYTVTSSGRGAGSDDPFAYLARPSPEAFSEVDHCTWAIQPFRTSGAHASVAGLGAGLPDLLNGILNPSLPQSGVLPLEPEVSVDDARRHALERRYWRIVSGSIVGGPDRITVRAENRGTRTGRVLGSESVEGPLDSLQALVSRLALQLSIPTMDASTRIVIEETPPAAVEATLEGMTTLCAAQWGQGDERQWIEAVRPFERALEIDSTFAMAAIELSRAGFFFPFQSVQYDFGAARARAWQFRDRLTAAERMRLEPQEGDALRYTTVAVEAWRGVVSEFPNAYWVRERLENELFYRGEYAEIDGWADELLLNMRAMAEMEDEPINCQEIWVLSRLPEVPEDRWDDYAHCPALIDPLARAQWRRDGAEYRRLRDAGVRSDQDPSSNRYFAVQYGFDISEWGPGLDGWRDSIGTFIEELEWARERFAYERINGRPEAAARFADSVTALTGSVDYANLQAQLTPWHMLAKAIEAAVYEPGPAPYLPVLEARMFSFPDTAAYGSGWNNSYNRLCPIALARVVHGDTTRTAESLATLHAWVDEHPRPRLALCPEMIAAMFERTRLGDRYAVSPAPALARLDSIYSLGPKGDVANMNGPLILARLYWERADTTNAYKWVRRRQINRHMTYVMPPWLRLDGRISAAAGDLDRARRMYGHYLVLREDPEPGALTAQRDSVRAELACIDNGLVDQRDPDLCGYLLGEDPGETPR